MSEIKEITKKVIKFRNDRDWKQFHNPKDVAISMCLEAAEVLEHFQWKSKEEIEEYVKSHKHHIGEELADVFKYLVILSHDVGIDIVKAVDKKMIQDGLKYPIEKARGNHTKYNKL